MNQKTLVKFAGLAMALLMSTGCATKVRIVSAEAWAEDGAGVYIAYWEGKCYGSNCDTGDGMVQWCRMRDDNSLACDPQEAVNSLLNAKGKAATSTK